MRRGGSAIGGQADKGDPFDAAKVGALAHLYRGEVYRSTIWRTRLDTSTNWAVVTLGVALSISFSSPNASPLPLVLVGVLIVFFLMLEARRYRYFNVWRARARWIETHFYAPLLNGDALNAGTGWTGTLAEDYLHPRYHVSFMTSVGRRIRRNYLWILLIQTLAYAGKLAVHPFPVESVEQALRRADVGPVPGEVMVGLGGAYILGFAAIALWSYHADARRARERGATGAASMG
jgi:uncharacterized membrane protein